MTVVFIAWRDYQGFIPTVKCAVARSGCPVYVISENPMGLLNVHWTFIFEFQTARRVVPMLHYGIMQGDDDLHGRSMGRHLLLNELLESPQGKDITRPVICPDWDMPIFSDLNKAYAPFRRYDVARTVNWPHWGDTSAVYGHNNLDPLRVFCKGLMERIRLRDPKLKNSNDMADWGAVLNESGYRVADLTEIHDDGVFDHNIHCDHGIYEMDGSTKRIVFKDNSPHFVRRETGKLVKAHWVHCWGDYKGKEAELMKQAGIE